MCPVMVRRLCLAKCMSLPHIQKITCCKNLSQIVQSNSYDYFHLSLNQPTLQLHTCICEYMYSYVNACIYFLIEVHITYTLKSYDGLKYVFCWGDGGLVLKVFWWLHSTVTWIHNKRSPHSLKRVTRENKMFWGCEY